MKYTAYFAEILKSQGVPNLSPGQFARMMNIISLEGKLRGIEIGDAKSGKDLLMAKWPYQKQLTELTGNLKPDILIQEMVRFSAL